ncbi:MAG: iron-containing alcohol dehydrogenase [Candidatus Micrarchaeota archaeon]|nr:iron-containing alcohol dehydrogenase [Candidatus Micrarchaeota archaeon]
MIKEFKAKKPVILTSKSNLALADALSEGRAILVESISVKHAKELIGRIERMEAGAIIGMGGGKVLDTARFCAIGVDAELVMIPPTLASTALSVDKSVVVDEKGERDYIITRAPDRVIVSLPFVMGRPYDELAKWSSSGFGDCFARLATAMDKVYFVYGATLSGIVRSGEKDAFELLEWASSKFERYDEAAVTKLAEALHSDGLRSIREGVPSLPGSEHVFARALESAKARDALKPTHGQAVSIGILVTAHVSGELGGDKGIFEMVKDAFRKIGLPTTLGKLEKVGVRVEDIANAMREAGKRKFDILLRDHWEKAAESVVGIYSEG